MEIEKEIHAIPKAADIYELPPACYTMTSSERYRSIDVLKSIKVPDGYTSNMSWYITIKDRKIA